MKKTFAVIALVFSVGNWAKAEGLKVEKLIVGTAIENKELVGEAKEFNAGEERVYAWSKAVAETVPTQIKYVWYADGKNVAEVPLDIKSPAARTWSSKKVWPGQWKVEATDSAGTVLSSAEFTVGSTAPAAAAQ